MSLRLLLWLGLALSLGVAFQNVFAQVAPVAAVNFVASSTNENTHKLQVRDAAMAKLIESQGGQLIADYGGYRLYEISELAPELATNPAVELRDGYNAITLHAGHLDTRKAAVKALRHRRGTFSGKRMHLVQFAGPVQPQWREELLAAGVQIVSYLPENSYLVYGDAASLSRVQDIATSAPHVQWEGEYLDDYKINPRARMTDAKGNPREIGTEVFDIQLMGDDDANAATLQLLDQLKLEPFRRRENVLHYVNVVVRLDAKQLARVAAQPDVVAILPYFPRKKLDERQDQIVAGNLTAGIPNGPGYLAWLASVGFTQAQFTASGFSVDMSDSGIDNGTTAPGHFGLYPAGNTATTSRVIYNRLEGSPNAGSTLQGCDGHGNLNAHIVGGYDDFSGFPFADTNGFHYGLGVCPFVYVGSSVIFDPSNFTNPNVGTLQSAAYGNGARVSNNSWGSSDATYDSEAQNYDSLVRDAQSSVAGNQEMVIVFAAGNSGPNADTVDSPGTAKNVISVGAGENVQAFGGSDNSGITDAEADNAEDIVFFSSRGPCSDGRIKPDITAPGTHVSGGVFQATNNFTLDPDGIAGACFSGEGVSGGPDGSNFWPLGQEFYTASSGTSHSTPCVAGACALVRQYFINNFTNSPSAAMTKAYLMNSTRYMTGASANDTLPSPNQGMGELNLGIAFDGTPRLMRDEVAADLFTATGQTRTFTGTITATTKPVRVTLAWTDAPGSLSANAYNNNLDLTVTVGGNTYKGNVFSGAFSITGGTADVKNNVESVFLPAGVSGEISVTVTATSINSVGVPNTGNALEQDFALVIYNAAVTPFAPGAATLTAENCTPTNGVIDPGETVTVSFAVQNETGHSTTNLVGTLLASGGVVLPSSPQNYGAIAAGATAAQPFTFMATGVCGGTVTATLQLQDGAGAPTAVTYTLPLGKFTLLTNAQNFDGVTAPALPVGWTTTNSGAEPLWTTVSTTNDSAPNAAFVGDVATVAESSLFSPAIAIFSTNAQLTFRNDYRLETSTRSSTGFDGGVLEIQIGGGAFMDILTAGGAFVTNGYNRTISSSFGNPLGGRKAWSGNSGGFITTVVKLPATAAGQTIVLRWRCGTDNANTGTAVGWWIDTISITDSTYLCCSEPTPVTITQGPTNLAVAAGSNAVFNTTATGTAPLDYQWFFNNATISGATNSSLTLTNAQTNQSGPYFVIVSNSTSAATSAVATLAVVTPPAFTQVPTNQSVMVGATAVFQSLASGGLLNYQWFLNSTNLAGATTNSLTVTNVQPNEAGIYTITVTNLAGTASASAQLSVILPPLKITVTATNVAVALPSVASASYTLQFKNVITATNWTSIAPPVTSTGGVITLHDPTPSATQRFYRVIAQ